MAIIGRIRKHSGLAVIIVGVAIAAFVIGDFGKKRSRGSNDIGSVNGEAISYPEFNTKVEQTIDIQKENSKNEKISDEDVYSIRQNTWTTMVKDIIMGNQNDELGLVVSPEELFDQVQGKNPHRYILQYFKDPKTGQYDPALVINYLKNLDQMEAKNKDQWIRFEKAIKEDRIQTKYNNLIAKGYYVPTAFARKQSLDNTRMLTLRLVAPNIQDIPDKDIKITDADYQRYYNEYKAYFEQEEPTRDLDYVVFDVVPSDADRKKISQDVEAIFRDFQTSSDVPNFVNANSDKKYDSTFQKKGQLPGRIDSIAFTAPSGTIIPPFEFNNAWYMAKCLATQDRPDSMKASIIVVTWEGTKVSETVKRTKAQAKLRADSILLVLKKSPERFTEFAKTISDYPTAKEDGGDLKWFTDGSPNFSLFFKEGMGMKVNDMKVLETGVGYSVFKLTDKTKPIKKVQVAVLQRQIAPSNQTYQDTYIKASAFAGQNKNSDAFDKATGQQGLQKRSAQSVKAMDNNIQGMTPAREIVRWSFAENTKVGEISPVFDLSGKYVVAVLKGSQPKGPIPLDKIKDRIQPAVKNEVKARMMGEKMGKLFMTNKDLYSLAPLLNAKVDTARITFSGYSSSAIGRENEIIGQTFAMKQNVVSGPFNGKFGAYILIIDNIKEPPAKKDYNSDRNTMMSGFAQRVQGSLYEALKKTATIKDDRIRFY
jgi:peptidyl-prolyl cis-trans isomerase D